MGINFINVVTVENTSSTKTVPFLEKLKKLMRDRLRKEMEVDGGNRFWKGAPWNRCRDEEFEVGPRIT